MKLISLQALTFFSMSSSTVHATCCTGDEVSGQHIANANIGSICQLGENYGANDTAYPETSGTTRQQLVNSQSGKRALVWAISSATAIHTTKRLMVNHNYPATIAFRTFGVTLLVYAMALLKGSESSHLHGNVSKWGIRRPEWLQLLPNQTWRGMISASLMAAMSVPMLFQSVLHMPNLGLLVMLFPIIPAAKSFVLFIYYSSQSPRRQYQEVHPLWWAIITIAASGVILYNENRLMVPGLIWGITSLIFIGVAQALFTIELRHEYGIEIKLQSFHGFIIMTHLCGLFFSSVAAYLFELPIGLRLPRQTLELMFVNVVSLVATTFTGTSLLAYFPISLADTKVAYSSDLISGSENFASFASSILVLLASLSSMPATVVSPVQIATYMLAFLCVLRIDQALDSANEASNLAQQSLQMFRTESRVGTPRKVISISGVLFLVGALGVALSALESMSLALLSSPDSSSLDSSYNASSSFDIVVSAYHEEPELIKGLLDSLKKTEYISNLRPNVILYTKDPEANITALKKSTGANVVKLLENVGREGGTYLKHIVTNWDTLAEKTMFIQAHAHNMRELLPRIDSYLVADTGMLSLGFTGVTCSCLNCQDRWGWEDYGGVIPTLHQEIYNQTCDSDTRILLSYKGQFVGSAKRIRGINKSIYEKLLLAITTNEGWGHDRDSLVHEQSLDNPTFGFTMERIWGLVMQCATDGRVAARCPSLLSGKGIGGDVRDCQCLDL